MLRAEQIQLQLAMERDVEVLFIMSAAIYQSVIGCGPAVSACW
jgi:hypothetical protein